MPRRRDIGRLRLDLGSIDNATAQKLLLTYGPLCKRIITDFIECDHAELESAAALAVLEAFLTHDPERAPEHAWIAQVVRWRLSEVSAQQRTLRAREWPIGASLLGAESLQTNGRHDPEVGYLRDLMQSAISFLEPREALIIDGLLRGETYDEISSKLGIRGGRATVYKAAKRAFDRLRDWAEHGLS